MFWKRHQIRNKCEACVGPNMGLQNVEEGYKIATELVFYVNGKKVVEPNPEPEWTLLWYLRNKLRLTGIKLGCGEGGCGACTVMVSKYHHQENRITHLAVNGCLAPVCAMHGLAVTTIEGIGSTKTKLHSAQERIAKANGSQCGYCTPGIVMSMYTLLRSCEHINYLDMEVAFQGNLCRCTGYRPIIEGYKSFIKDKEPSRIEGVSNTNVNSEEKCPCAMGKDCCKNKGNDDSEMDHIIDKSSFLPYDPSQEPIFPPELKLTSEYDDQELVFTGKNSTWYRPKTLESILELKEKYPEARIVVGNTEVGIEVKFKNYVYHTRISPINIPEMNSVIETETGLTIGASVTLSKIEAVCKKYIDTQPTYKTRTLKAIVDMLNWFAGKQVRNVAALAGNIMTGSPLSDLNPILMSLKAKLNLQSKNEGHRSVFMDETFFTGYRKNIVKPNEILLSIEIPFSTKYQYVTALKQARRRENDETIVTTAINVEFEDKDNVIKNISIAFANMASVTKLATKTGKALKGEKWNENMLEKAYNAMLEEMPLDPSVPGGNTMFRKALIMSLFFKAYLGISNEISQDLMDEEIKQTNKKYSRSEEVSTKIPKSSEYFEIVGDKQARIDQKGKPIHHRSAFKQATGEAIYCNDMPHAEGELYLAFVLSTKAHAKLISIDPKEALKQPGVVAFFSAKDLKPEANKIGSIVQDEELFISEIVTSQGQTIGVIIAQDQTTAQAAARMVQVQYEEIKPIIVTIEDAIKHNSVFPPYPKHIRKGDVKTAFGDKNNVIVEGECHIGGQEHFYLETNTAFAIPKKEDGEMEIFCSNQNPSEISKLTSHILDVPINRIVTRVKRVGGGFGGKESRNYLVALPAAFAAHKLQKPIRCMLDRDEDMRMTGTRHPFLYKYKAAATKEGKIVAAIVKIYSNAGYSLDLSGAILEKSMFHFENSYYIPNVEVSGYACKTNIHSNTAFRGFGAPQGMFCAENMMRHIAMKLGKPAEEICRLNLYQENMATHFGQVLTHCTLQRCWEECVEKSNLERRKREIEVFNKKYRWRKRGISITPTMFGIAFTIKVLNQAGALVLIYVDGSVLVSHGGTELGQGLYTKMIQVASRALEIDIAKIHITETSTDKVPNTSATAASSSSDLNGMAVLRACQTLVDRLKPYKEKNPNGTWEQWVSAAYEDRVSLAATGFYATPDIGYDFDTGTGTPFNYFTFGVAVTEVEIDCLSGDHHVLRTDIVMDVGESLNPAIDVGQIEGAFVQGYGLFTLEELIYSPDGTLHTIGPGTYKLPGFGDIPLEFNVSLLKGAPNPKAVYSSKAIGEPPLFLGSSAFFAIREAIGAARRETGASPEFRLDSPATAAHIRMACEDNITRKLKTHDPDIFVPWNAVP